MNKRYVAINYNCSAKQDSSTLAIFNAINLSSQKIIKLTEQHNSITLYLLTEPHNSVTLHLLTEQHSGITLYLLTEQHNRTTLYNTH